MGTTPVTEMDAIQRRDAALALAFEHGLTDGIHHKTWLLDQMCQILLGDEYQEWVAKIETNENGERTRKWEQGLVP